jgi:hypothetical protein
LQERHIPQRRRGAAGILAVDADRTRAAVGEALVGAVATGARQGAVPGEQRIREKVTTQVDLLRREAVAVRRQGRARAAHAAVFERVVELVDRTQLADPRRGLLETRRAARIERDVGLGAGTCSARTGERQQQRDQAPHLPW